jgi:cell division protein FtsL
MAVRPAPQRPGRVLRPEAAPTPRPHLQVVPPGYLSAGARRRRARRLVVLAGIAVAALLFGVVAFHVVLTQGQLDLQQLQARAQSASVHEQQLRLEAAQLESPERVVQDAQHLGMVPPATVRYLTPASDPAAPPTTRAPGR